MAAVAHSPSLPTLYRTPASHASFIRSAKRAQQLWGHLTSRPSLAPPVPLVSYVLSGLSANVTRCSCCRVEVSSVNRIWPSKDKYGVSQVVPGFEVVDRLTLALIISTKNPFLNSFTQVTWSVVCNVHVITRLHSGYSPWRNHWKGGSRVSFKKNVYIQLQNIIVCKQCMHLNCKCYK